MALPNEPRVDRQQSSHLESTLSGDTSSLHQRRRSKGIGGQDSPNKEDKQGSEDGHVARAVCVCERP